jgi:anti-sigma regulatory factor (Ser/Thr protein kinase)
MSQNSAAGQAVPATTLEPVLRAELPADPGSARQARRAARRAMEAWGMADLSGDTELLASELVTNAVEHSGGQSIGFVLRRLADVEGQDAVTCEVSDSSPVLPKARDAGPDADRGRGLAIVTALASASGVWTSPGGKTTWFTLALSRCA